MQKLTIGQFKDRLNAIQKARKIFIETGLTKNISHAFDVYQSILADTVETKELNTLEHGNRFKTSFDEYVRPICPICGTGGMRFRPIYNDPTGIQSLVVCSNYSCDSMWESKKSINDWKQILQDKLLINFKAMKRISKKAKLPGKRVQSHMLMTACPKCKRQTLYAISPCCGAPDGIIECNQCDFQQPLNQPIGVIKED